jgi:hypothetical protein
MKFRMSAKPGTLGLDLLLLYPLYFQIQLQPIEAHVGLKSVVTATPIQSLPTLDQHKLTSRVEDTAIVNAYIVAL